MTDAIGRGDYKVGLDYSDVSKGVDEAEQEIKDSGTEIERAYETAGRRAAERFRTVMSVGFKAVAVVAAGAFAVASKGVLELENITADFRAETGATEQAAKKAGDAILAMSSRNIQPLGEIGAALTKVHTDLGLTGDEAEVMTERFLRFARATKQDAAASVLAFDDILDAWNLTAGDTERIMDLLVASHQRYGGSIEENQRQLAQMAPQLRALNLNVDDGIGLLNLFAASGLDAGKAQFALNSAIQKMPKGETFDSLIARLSAIEDPAERARAAIEIFGARGGAALANVLRPGIQSLDDFKVSQEDATGATERAADAMDSTFGARAQLLIKQFGSAVIGLGRDIGPVFTMLGAIGSAGAALGLGKFVPKLVELFKDAGQKAGEALIDGVGTATGAAGTIIGNFFASRIENVLDPDKNSLLGRIYRSAAAKIGLVMGPVIAAATWLQDALMALWTRTGLAGPLRATILAIAIQHGTLAGTAMGRAIGAGFLVGLAAIAPDIRNALQSVGDQLRNTILGPNSQPPLEAVGRWIDSLPWPLGPKGSPDWVKLGADTAAGAAGLTGSLQTFADGSYDAVERARAAVGRFPEGVKAVVPGTQEGSSGIGAAIKTIGEAASDAAVRVVTATLSIEGNIIAMRDRLVAGAQASANAIFDPIIEKNRLAALETQKSNLLIELSDKDTTKARKREIRAQITEIDKQLFIQESVVASHGDATARIADEKAKLQRVLVELQAKGLNKDQRALLEARAREHRSNIDKMERDAAKGGSDIRDGFIGPLAKMPGQTRTIARNTRGALSGSLSDIPTYGWGARAARRFAEGLESMQHAVNQAASRLAGAVGDYLKVSSPAKTGPLSELGGPEGWGERIAMLLSRGAERNLPRLGDALRRALSGELAGPALSGLPTALGTRALTEAMATSPAGSTSTSRTVQVNGGIHLSVELPQGAQATDGDIRRLMERLGNEVRMTLVPHLSGL